MPKLYINFSYIPKPSSVPPPESAFQRMSVEMGELSHSGTCACKSCNVAQRVWSAVSSGRHRGAAVLQEGLRVLGALKALGIL